jgi:hypothetical protein
MGKKDDQGISQAWEELAMDPENKVAYVDGIEALIKQWDEQIEEMEKKGVSQDQLQKLREKKDMVRHKLNALDKEPEDSWQHARPELEKLKDEARQAFDQAPV